MHLDGYKYWLAYKKGTKSYYRCSRSKSQKCPGKIIMENSKVITFIAHDHEKEARNNSVEKFRKVLTKKAVEKPNKALVDIYLEETLNHSEASILYPFAQAESTMRKARSKGLEEKNKGVKGEEKVANKIDQKDKGIKSESTLRNCQQHQKYFYVENIGNDIQMIIMNQGNFRTLEKIEEIHIDCGVKIDVKERNEVKSSNGDRVRSNINNKNTQQIQNLDKNQVISNNNIQIPAISIETKTTKIQSECPLENMEILSQSQQFQSFFMEHISKDPPISTYVMTQNVCSESESTRNQEAAMKIDKLEDNIQDKNFNVMNIDHTTKSISFIESMKSLVEGTTETESTSETSKTEDFSQEYQINFNQNMEFLTDNCDDFGQCLHVLSPNLDIESFTATASEIHQTSDVHSNTTASKFSDQPPQVLNQQSLNIQNNQQNHSLTQSNSLINIQSMSNPVQLNSSHYHLITIIALIRGRECPIAFGLLKFFDQDSIDQFLQFFNVKMSLNPSTVLTSLNPYLEKSIRNLYPESTVKIMYFYYAQSVLKNLCKNFQEISKNIFEISSLKMILSMPLIPTNYVIPGWEALRKWMSEKNVNLNRICDDVYIKWLAKNAERISIFNGLTHSINNHTQVFQSELLNSFEGKSVDVEVLINKILRQATKMFLKFSNTNEYSAKKVQKLQKTVKIATKSWISSPFHLRRPIQFLQQVSHCIDDGMINFVMNFDGNFCEVKKRDPPPLIFYSNEDKCRENKKKRLGMRSGICFSSEPPPLVPIRR